MSKRKEFLNDEQEWWTLNFAHGEGEIYRNKPNQSSDNNLSKKASKRPPKRIRPPKPPAAPRPKIQKPTKGKRRLTAPQNKPKYLIPHRLDPLASTTPTCTNAADSMSSKQTRKRKRNSLPSRSNTPHSQSMHLMDRDGLYDPPTSPKRPRLATPESSIIDSSRNLQPPFPGGFERSIPPVLTGFNLAPLSTFHSPSSLELRNLTLAPLVAKSSWDSANDKLPGIRHLINAARLFDDTPLP